MLTPDNITTQSFSTNAIRHVTFAHICTDDFNFRFAASSAFPVKRALTSLSTLATALTATVRPRLSRQRLRES